MEKKDGKWRQPLLRDGNPVPVAAYSNRTESRIEFNVSCRNLLNNTVEDAKCFCVAYSAEGSPDLKIKGTEDVDKFTRPADLAASCLEIGRTEVVYNNNNPDFASTFSTKISAYFDKLHDIIILVYSEEDVMSDDLKKQRYLGCARFRLERVLRAVSFSESHPLEAGGCVSISARPSELDCDFLVFCYSGKDFKKSSKNPVMKAKKRVPKNPYIVVSYKNKKHSKWRVLWKSESVRGSDVANFGFGQFQVSRVNGADEETPIQILAMDWDEKHHKYKTIGQAETTLREMSADIEIDFIKKGKCTGHLVPEFVERVNIPSVVNYLFRGGCSLDVTFAVDFTSNNGGPGNPESMESLHHRHGNGELNAYETVLKNVGSLFEEYSDEPKFQLWGYGAISDSIVDHRFAMGGGVCDGAHSLMSAYAETVRSNITMSGPKLIRPTIDAAIGRAMQSSQSESIYSILIILCCDGTIGDIGEVMEKVSQASFVPLSIAFVGIGDGDFEDLNAVNYESASLVSPLGNEFMRDVASFVRLSNDNKESVHKILERIPGQLVSYNLSQGNFPPEQLSEDVQEKELAQEKRKKTAETSMETVKTNNRTTTDYGKFLLDSMAALDSDEEELDASEPYRLEGSSSEEFDT